MNQTKVALIAVLLCASCQIVKETATYSPPTEAPRDTREWSRTIDQPFDEVWRTLIDHAFGAFFVMDSFEKDSGLMTLSFGANEVGDFVDGGWFVYERTKGHNATRGIYNREPVSFDGPYIEWLDRLRDLRLSGQMNVLVREEGAERTHVKVRALYEVRTFVGFGSRSIEDRWNFDTEGSDTVLVNNTADGAGPTRTMRPTHKAEASILEVLDALVSQ